jgi:hypothetical protein
MAAPARRAGDGLGAKRLCTLLETVEPFADRLGVRELCRLGQTCQQLRAALAPSADLGLYAPEHAWARVYGARGARGPLAAVSRAQLAAELGGQLWWDETTTTGARLTSADGRRALLVLGAQPAPFRVCAVASAQWLCARTHAQQRSVVEWEVAVHALHAAAPTVLWLGLTFCRGAAADDGAGALDRAALAKLLAPFAAGCQEAGPGARRAAGSFAERFAESSWPIFALGSTGFVWGSGVGGRSFGEGAPWAQRALGRGADEIASGSEGAPLVVRVRLDVARGELSFQPPGGGPMHVAARRVFARGEPLPSCVYAIAHLTDCVARTAPPGPRERAALARALDRAAAQQLGTGDAAVAVWSGVAAAEAVDVGVAAARRTLERARVCAYADVELGPILKLSGVVARPALKPTARRKRPAACEE